jgi:hypothetical protein
MSRKYSASERERATAFCKSILLAEAEKMRLAEFSLGTSFVLGLAAFASADVMVSNYSWLQLPADEVKVSVGGVSTPTPSGHGNIGDIRWGNFVWTPHKTLSANGTASYWAAVTLDKPRLIESVRVDMWNSDGEGALRYYVDGQLPDGTWINIGVQEFASLTNQGLLNTSVIDTIDGVYQTVRVRFEPGDYTAGGSYGGPGLYMIEPIGSGELKPYQVNIANRDLFGTTVVNTFDTSIGGRLVNSNGIWNAGVNGTLSEGNTRAGVQGSFLANDEIVEQMVLNLNGLKKVDTITLVGNGASYTPLSFTITYSPDGGSTYLPVTLLSGPTFYPADAGYRGAVSYTFEDVMATHVRITNASMGSSGYALITQILAYNLPEPASMGLLMAAGAIFLRRRR